VADAFEKRLGGAGNEVKGGSAWAPPRGGGRRRRGGPSMTVGSSGRLAMTRYNRARAAPLPREQRRAAGVGVAGDGVSVADGRDRGEAGPGGSS
jgi:hypothetical protein